MSLRFRRYQTDLSLPSLCIFRNVLRQIALHFIDSRLQDRFLPLPDHLLKFGIVPDLVNRIFRESGLFHNVHHSEIIEKKGVDGFIEVENEVNASIEAEQSVIATGGSAVYGKEAMEHFREIGAVIYLQVDYEVIRKRLHNIKRRGVALRENQTLRDLYDERCALYEKYADMIVREGSGEIEDVVARIIRTIKGSRIRDEE